MTGTNELLSTAPSSRLYNGSFQPGPLGLHVPILPRGEREVLPEVGVEDLTKWGLQLLPVSL